MPGKLHSFHIYHFFMFLFFYLSTRKIKLINNISEILVFLHSSKNWTFLLHFIYNWLCYSLHFLMLFAILIIVNFKYLLFIVAESTNIWLPFRLSDFTGKEMQKKIFFFFLDYMLNIFFLILLTIRILQLYLYNLKVLL